MAEAPAPAKKKVSPLKIAGYVALGIFSFCFFLYLHFFVIGEAPAERILIPSMLDRAEQQANVRIEYDRSRISGDIFGGVTLKDVEVYMVATRGMFANDPSPEPLVEIDSLRLGLKPLKLLTGKVGASIKAKLYGGTLKGVLAGNKKGATVDLEAADIDLRLHTFLPNKFGVNPEGILGGTVDLKIPLKEARGGVTPDLSTAVGTVQLRLDQAALAESNLMGMQKIPEVSFQDAGVDVEMAEGSLNINQLGLEGDDLSVTLDGDMKLNESFARSTINSEITIKMSKTFESSLDPLFMTGINPGKQSDGTYKYALRGSVRRLKPRPVRSSSSRSRRR